MIFKNRVSVFCTISQTLENHFSNKMKTKNDKLLQESCLKPPQRAGSNVILYGRLSLTVQNLFENMDFHIYSFSENSEIRFLKIIFSIKRKPGKINYFCKALQNRLDEPVRVGVYAAGYLQPFKIYFENITRLI